MSDCANNVFTIKLGAQGDGGGEGMTSMAAIAPRTQKNHTHTLSKFSHRVAPKTTGATTAAEEVGVAVAGDDDTGVGLEATPAADTGVAAAGEDDMGAGLPPTPAVDASVAAAGGVEADVRSAAPAPGGVAAEMGLAKK
ncbi:unnamed protein product [Ectocarpus sp. CCAP 1310/34]|nr:unnamed protein product [Ectocarpus sp. CCAP 1310/34]